MSGIFIGMICGVVGCLIVNVVQYIFAWEQAKRVKKPDEMIVCSNATVLMDSNGELAWVNNDRIVPVRKK